MRIALIAVLLLALPSCSVHPLRAAAEREAVALTEQLADDFFAGKPVPPASVQAAVRAAIVDIKRRLNLAEAPK